MSTGGCLAGRTAVVTGSASGIGRATALRLARAGANVIVSACKSKDAANELAQELRGLSVEATVLMVDLADPAATRTFIEQAWAWQRGVDIWVNNAGVDVLTGEVATLTFEQKLERLWQVDVMATIRCSRDVGERMRQAGQGVIINVGWDQSWEGMEGDAGEMFGTIKGAVMAYTKSLAKTLAPTVRANCVAPGWIKTSWGDDAPPYWQQRAVGESLRHRWGTPEDVAAAICFLASDEADFINGQILPVNGGFCATSGQRRQATQ